MHSTVRSRIVWTPLFILVGHLHRGTARRSKSIEFAEDIEIGTYAFKYKNYRGAELRFRHALEYKPGQPDATFKLAESLDKLGKSDEAKQQYQAYLSSQPHGPHADRARAAPSACRRLLQVRTRLPSFFAIGAKSPLHSKYPKKASKRRKLVKSPGYESCFDCLLQGIGSKGFHYDSKERNRVRLGMLLTVKNEVSVMSKKAAEHHHKASEHHQHASHHHKEAAKHHEAGRHETAAHHAHLARGHHEHASHHASEAAKAHIEEHGK